MTDFILNFRYRTKGIVLNSASNFILKQKAELRFTHAIIKDFQIACKCKQLHVSAHNCMQVTPNLLEWEALGFFYMKSNVFWSIRFLLYEIKRVLVDNSTIFKHSWRDNLLIYGFVVPYFFIQNMYMPLKKYFGNKLCLMGQIGIR